MVAANERNRIESARREAMAALRSRYEALRRAHDSIASKIESHSPEGEALLQSAARNIDRWEAEHLCSEVYVKVWRRILRRPERIRSQVVSKRGVLSDSLLQNSPFGAALKESLHH